MGLYFLSWQNIHNRKFAILTFVSMQFCGIKYIHILHHHHYSPPELFSSQTETLYSRNIPCPFPPPPTPCISDGTRDTLGTLQCVSGWLASVSVGAPDLPFIDGSRGRSGGLSFCDSDAQGPWALELEDSIHLTLVHQLLPALKAHLHLKLLLDGWVMR